MRWLPFLILIFLTSCRLNSSRVDPLPSGLYKHDLDMKIENAEGFEVHQNDSLITLKINSLSSAYPFTDSLIFPRKQLGSGTVKLWQPDWNRFACQSTTHLTFLNALGKFKSVVALSDIDYMPKDDIYQRVEKQGLEELNINNSVNIEKLVSLQTDLFFMYPFEWEIQKYKEASIKTLLIAEYLEHTAVARLEWIKVFGLLVGEEKLADSIFSEVKAEYEQLELSGKNIYSAFFNLPFKEIWDMPAANSISVNLIKDAGLNYVFDNDTQSIDNISMAKEAVWAKVHSADFWIIIASRPKGYALEDLVQEEDVYQTFNSVQKKQVLFCNTSESSYFTQGILEPHIMLKDILYLTHQITDYKPKYFHLLK
ncbi:MAG: ABC transporter substrate-binding protein [Crocinitomicaceae bacterium]